MVIDSLCNGTSTIAMTDFDSNSESTLGMSTLNFLRVTIRLSPVVTVSREEKGSCTTTTIIIIITVGQYQIVSSCLVNIAPRDVQGVEKSVQRSFRRVKVKR
jgi:hypothetical protein